MEILLYTEADHLSVCHIHVNPFLTESYLNICLLYRLDDGCSIWVESKVLLRLFILPQVSVSDSYLGGTQVGLLLLLL